MKWREVGTFILVSHSPRDGEGDSKFLSLTSSVAAWTGHESVFYKP